jgi:hypothetical protein
VADISTAEGLLAPEQIQQLIVQPLMRQSVPNHGRQETPTADEGGRMIGAPWVVGRLYGRS